MGRGTVFCLHIRAGERFGGGGTGKGIGGRLEEGAAGEGGGVALGEYVGEVVNVMFLKEPMYTVVLQERDGSGGADAAAVAGGAVAGGVVIRSTSVDVFCKYVRREIRSLFDDERDEMFDAMKVGFFFRFVCFGVCCTASVRRLRFSQV